MEKLAKILMLGFVVFALLPAANAEDVKIIDLDGEADAPAVAEEETDEGEPAVDEAAVVDEATEEPSVDEATEEPSVDEATVEVTEDPAVQETAEDLLEKIRLEESLKAQHDRYLVEHLVKSGKTRFYDLEYGQAKTDLEKALAINPNHIEAKEYLRKTNMILDVREGRYEGMIDAVRDTAKIERELMLHKMNVLFDRGRNEFDNKEYGKAIDSFGRARDLAKYISPYYDVSMFQTQTEDYLKRAEAELELKRIADEEAQRTQAEEVARLRNMELLKTEATRIAHLLANCRDFMSQGRYQEARSLAESILKKDPGNSEAKALSEAAFNANLRSLRAKTSEGSTQETLLVWAGTREAQVPYSDILVYPDNWAEIAKRQVTDIGAEPEEVESWRPELERSLGEPVSFDFHATPLQDVVSFLQAITNVQFFVSTKAVEERDDPRVTLKVNDMELGKALEWVLRDIELSYALKDNAIYISTPDDVAGDATTRFYDVTDIIVQIRDFPGNLKALHERVGTSTGDGGGDDWGPIGLDDWGDEGKKDDVATPESLIDLIKRTIAPGTWDD